MNDLPSVPPPMPQPPEMKPRWIGWVAASTLLPILPWLVLGKKADQAAAPVALVLLGFALICQLVASIMVADGLSKKRTLGVGGTVGLSVVFMFASLAIGTAIFFVACVSVASFH